MNELVDPRLGMSRRDLLRRGAIVGGTLVWAAPAVQTIARPAFGSTEGTPVNGDAGKDFSYIAVRYECNGVTHAVKFDFHAVGNVQCTVASLSGPPPHSVKLNTPQCSFNLSGVSDTPSNHCSKFDFSYPNGDLTKITVIMTDHNNCLLSGVGVGKCGNPENPQSGGECVEVSAPAAGATSLTFDLCGA